MAKVRAKPGNLDNVQALRALAAVMVIVVHLEFIVTGMGGVKADAGLFSVGVDLFFMISGFIMVYTTTARKIGPLAFLLNRYARIAPLYWMITLITVVTTLSIPSLTPHTVVTGSTLLKSLLFIPYVRFDGMVRPILFLGWSLNLEMMFYLIFAGSLVISNVATRVACCVGLLCVAVFSGIMLHDRLPPEIGFLLQPLLLEFAIGMVIGLLYNYLPKSVLAGQIAVFVVPLSFATLLLFSRNFYSPFVPISSLPAAMLLLSCLVANRSGFVVRSPAILLIGDASYAIYLVHPFVTQTVVKISEIYAPMASLTLAMLLIVAMIAAILVGIATHFTLEKPLGTMVRRWMRPHRLLAEKTVG